MNDKSDHFRVFVLRTIGNFLVLASLAGVFLTFLPAIKAETVFRYGQMVGQRFVVVGDVDPCGEKGGIVSGPGQIKCRKAGLGASSNLLLGQPQTMLAIEPIDRKFGLVIPKIGANARVVSGVDPGKFDVYIDALKHGVAHAAGTAYPGEVGNSFLFAHSVGSFWEVNQWNAVFYLLRELEPGDEVDVFYQGRRYVYRVYDKRVVEPTDVHYLSTQANFPMLTLQTCWPPGTTLKRLLVFARLEGN